MPAYAHILLFVLTVAIMLIGGYPWNGPGPLFRGLALGVLSLAVFTLGMQVMLQRGM